MKFDDGFKVDRTVSKRLPPVEDNPKMKIKASLLVLVLNLTHISVCLEKNPEHALRTLTCRTGDGNRFRQGVCVLVLDVTCLCEHELQCAH